MISGRRKGHREVGARRDILVNGVEGKGERASMVNQIIQRLRAGLNQCLIQSTTRTQPASSTGATNQGAVASTGALPLLLKSPDVN